MVLISNRFGYITFSVLVWISSSFYHFSLSLDEPLIFFDEHCEISDNFGCKSVGNIGNKQVSECSRWLKETTSMLGKDVPPSIISVIIVAHNERKRILNDTIESLLSNTSHALLKEIIVVDDCSQPAIDLTPNGFKIQVSLIRNTVRQGLIRSRIIGANEASGNVLVFADSHIHFAKDWLKPLVLRLLYFERFKSSSHLLVLSPFISAFTEDGEDYPATDYLRGGFDWDLTFVWEPMNDEEKDNLNTYGRQMNLTWLSLPRPSPVIAGSVIAVNRSRFIAFGAFDDQMEIWGGENIELSLRAWMCGGRVEIIPCSRVSHLFRSSHGYSFPKGKMITIVQNLKRVAMVWMQPSRDLHIDSVRYPVPPIALFYSSQQDALNIPARDLALRERLRQRLECKDFAWFVENIYPDLKRKGSAVKLRDNAMIKAQLSKLISKLK
ncbi:Polypeptide N-acetylgalactosaminyltransferase 16 [Echinococcus granulosus]|uniref:Polypeptide n=2 Tax=Echinococcus granulosus TaxID=6210 RepID=A0A068WDE8_ECHGR|nr:Polypeptide N-acetylgalactosaminyltransferase 16 [Echinococcus granulosus]CDS15640.1 polypeptide [Echinococcus granulosus]